MTEQFPADHIHTTPEGRHFRHGDGVEVDGEGDAIETQECIYCGRDVPATDAVPAAGDDDAWGRLAPHHAAGCEWIETRAHRR